MESTTAATLSPLLEAAGPSGSVMRLGSDSDGAGAPQEVQNFDPSGMFSPQLVQNIASFLSLGLPSHILSHGEDKPCTTKRAATQR